MKKVFLLALSLLTFSPETFTQNFAPIGATWYYDYLSPDWEQGYSRLRVLRDSLVNGKSYRLIERYFEGYSYQSSSPEYFSYTRTPLLIRQSQDSVFLLLDEEEVLIHLVNVSVGDEWQTKANIHEGSCSELGTIRVISVGQEVINGNTYKFFETSSDEDAWEFRGKTYEAFGNQNFLLPQPRPWCNTEFSAESNLRCYSDANIGMIKWAQEDCEFITSIAEKTKPEEIYFDYNSQTIRCSDQITEVSVYSLEGKLMLKKLNTTNEISLKIPNGLYVVYPLVKGGIAKPIKIQIRK